MRTARSTPPVVARSRCPSPGRSTPWPGIRITVLALLAARFLAGPGEARSEQTYSVMNYPALQDGYTISGSITTDGTLGSITSADFLSWDIKISLAGSLVQEWSSSVTGSFMDAQVEATSTTLSVPSTDIMTVYFSPTPNQPNQIGWAGPLNPFGPGYQAALYPTPNNPEQLWQATLPSPYIVATAGAVPEPSTAVIAAIGAATLLTYGRARARRGTAGRRRGTDTRRSKGPGAGGNAR